MQKNAGGKDIECNTIHQLLQQKLVFCPDYVPTISQSTNQRISILLRSRVGILMYQVHQDKQEKLGISKVTQHFVNQSWNGIIIV